MMIHRSPSSPTIPRCLLLLLVLFVTTSTTVVVQAADDLCHLCGEGVSLAWPLATVRSDGATCNDMALHLAMLTPGSSTCRSLQSEYRFKCCLAPTKPAAVKVTPTPAPVVAGIGSGPHPICNICANRNIPGDKAMVINMLYLWEGTCMSYYEDGLKGRIPEYLCETLQFFGKEPCSCGTGQAPSPGNSGNANSNNGNGNGSSSNNNNKPPSTTTTVSSVTTLSSVASSGERKVVDNDAKDGNASVAGDRRGGAGGRERVRRRRLVKGQ